ncbi:hypothetical protein JOL79_20025 [Microbispora sp. RL4-1S]|uniref:HTH luxR-type domain-containing protein n=1 Tax=Microbispora oryzae TaxID=2806554 RepID=A0A940WIA0_9ACTN|nr:LuxR C-terminal-related transcriptional regulator [Microbispora oryzae]MBP2706100.1 hypothetical protein [Microbispora oryzae]
MLVLRGEPGIGRTALLDHSPGTNVRVVRSRGIRDEADLALGALHRILGVTGDADPLRDGIRATAAVADLSRPNGLLLIIDDAQWLDQPSAEALLFATRRTAGVSLVLACADGEGPACLAEPGLPELRLERLADDDAGRIVDTHAGSLPARVRANLVAAGEGNPRTLVTLARAVTADQRAGRLTSPWAPMESAVTAQPPVSDAARALLVLLAVMGARGDADLTTLLPAAGRVGASVRELTETERAGLVTVTGSAVAFRHPQARIAAYASAPLELRAAAHRAAAATPGTSARESVWHRAAAAFGPEEDTAAALVAAARRTGAEEAADALQAAAELSASPATRGERLALAASAAAEAGQRVRAAGLTAEARRHGVGAPVMWSGATAVAAALDGIRLRLLAGEGALALDAAGALVAGCRERELHGRLPAILEVVASCHIQAGGYEAARTAAAEGLDRAEHLGDTTGAARLHAVLAWLAAVTGAAVPAGRYELEDDEVRALRAWAEGAGDAARGDWSRMRGRPLPDGPLALLAGLDHMEAAMRVGDRARADEMCRRVEATAAAVAAPWTATLVSRCHALTGHGPWPEPAEGEDDPFGRGRGLLLHGEWLRRSRRRGAAAARFGEAVAIFERLGAWPWLERARAELSACGGEAARMDAAPVAPLTPQELRVARLAAAGATNREIAQSLALSPRTVGFHLYRAFRKLGVSSRAELAARTLPG